MESAGVYWKPVYNPRSWPGAGSIGGRVRGHGGERPAHEGGAGAQDGRQEPAPYWIRGRRVDCRPARHGLLRAGFIPDRPQRELRELTRYRRSLTEERSREANRIQKLLEGANIKLSSVATDVLGASGRAMLAALAAGETDPKALADLARGRLREKLGQLEEALRGMVQDHQRFMLSSHLRHLEHLDTEIEVLDQEVARRLSPFEAMVAALDTIPGVGRRTAQVIAAEVGTDMKQFPTPGHLASWAGVCPGEQTERGPAPTGSHPQRQQLAETGPPFSRGQALAEAAKSAGRTKTYLGGPVPAPRPAHRGPAGGDGGGPLHRRDPPPGHRDRGTLRRPGPPVLRGKGPGKGPGGRHPPGPASTPKPRPQGHPPTRLTPLFQDNDRGGRSGGGGI